MTVFNTQQYVAWRLSLSLCALGSTHVSQCCVSQSLFIYCVSSASPQYMSGGDLGSALDRDMLDSEESGSERRLGWYARGRVILLGVARGLTYLHGERVCPLPQTYPILPYLIRFSLLGMARGLTYLHSERVCSLPQSTLPHPTLPHMSSLLCDNMCSSCTYDDQAHVP